MKIILISFAFLLSISFVFAANPDSVTLTKCLDTDGDNPMTNGNITWEYNSSLGEGSGISQDFCSTVHYTNILLNIGEKFDWGEFVLVEGTCPNLNTIVDQPADLPVKKFYKCKCENNGNICEGKAEEIPFQKVKEAEAAWENDVKINKFSLNSFLLKFLRFFGLWG